MSTVIQYFCDRCKVEMVAPCIRYRLSPVVEEELGHVFQTPELCPDCLKDLLTTINTWIREG